MEDKYMLAAIKQAEKALKNGDVPVGAVIVKNNKIIAKSYNKREKTKNAINHAEILVIKKACSKLKDWRLNDCILYVTLEPCSMCMGAVFQSRIEKVIFGTKSSNVTTQNNKIEVLALENSKISKKCLFLLKDFFKEKRK